MIMARSTCISIVLLSKPTRVNDREDIKMVEINREVIIDAPLDRIFDYVSKPGNLPAIWPNLVLIDNEKLLPNGGYSFHENIKYLGCV